MAQPPKQLQGSSTRFRGSDRGWPAQRCGARCWPQPRTGRLTRCAHGHSHGEAESGMHGHTRPAGQQKPSPPVTARPILSIHPNRLGPSGLDRAIADRHARRGDANSHSPEGANVRFCVCWSTEIGGQVEGTIAVPDLAGPRPARRRQPTARASRVCLSLCPAKDFTVGYRQPTVRGRGPLSPRRGDLLELRGSGQTRIHQLVSQIGLQNPVGPH